MTGRINILNSPFLLGFDQFERTLDRIAKASNEGYPPYNIEQIGEDGLRITLAVAGFSEVDLSITHEDNQLIVRGRQGEDKNRLYLHRGIAARQFQRSFVLADGIDIKGAELVNGLLHIDLTRPLPESRVRHIKIATKQGSHKHSPSETVRKSPLGTPIDSTMQAVDGTVIDSAQDHLPVCKENLTRSAVDISVKSKDA
jgi:HSP20 family molecular chaperone IbpA